MNTRPMIIRLLKERPVTMRDLVGATGLGRSVIYYHLKSIDSKQSRKVGRNTEYWIGERNEQ